ncbi:MAG TPA: acyl-CoA dehydratase activase [Polyangia bacterium]|nr:acyl-CoA dehydratase activase [Polyangia bacterium]
MKRDDPAWGVPRVGVDIGSVNLHVFADGGGGRRGSWSRPIQGRPVEVFLRLLEEELLPLLGPGPVRLGVTGQGRDMLAGEVPCAPVNEVVAAVAGVRAGHPRVRTVIDLGGQLSKWILVGADGEIDDFATNGLCAAGSGAFLEQQASRLRVDVEEFGRVAAGAASGAKVAGRCSVFAKSDMIHLQQKGTPFEKIAYGVCQALARTFAATVLEGRTLESPAALVGGGAVNPGLRRALAEACGMDETKFLAVSAPLSVGARGAALLADRAPEVALATLAELDAAAIRRRRGRRAATMAPLPRIEPLVTSTTGREGGFRDGVASAGGEEPSEVEAWLGVDVGSVSTNLVLLTPGLEPVEELYLRTRGRPVEVLGEGLDLLRERFGDRLRILGCGTTGSGRHLAARVLGADVVRNEITAQLVSAAHFVPEVDTVFEIGGQDSKYIGLRDGHLASFEMNKICAAGTGSFLEEQAEMLDVSIFDEFAALALEAKAPRDLGTRCTVFMEAELRRAQQEGASLPDLCAGLAYSVARNYLEKVVSGRPVGECVVFQGGTASNAAVVAAMTAVLGREVRVHTHNRVSGAIGMALLAARERAETGYQPGFRGLEACRGSTSDSFECRACENRCQVSRIRLEGRTLHFGDACERFAGRDAEAESRVRPFPELFAERQRLFDGAVRRAGEPGRAGKRGQIGLPRGSISHELMPLWAGVVRGLGCEPVLSPPTDERIAERGARGLPAEVCLPIKIAAGHVRALAESAPDRPVLVPSVIDMPRAGDGEETFTCLLTQELPFMLPPELAPRLRRPQFGLGGGAADLLEAGRSLARELDQPAYRVAGALWRGLGEQRRFDDERRELGRRVLTAGFERAVVVIGRPYNLHDPHANLDLARHLDRVGLPAIPMDLLPLPVEPLDERWGSIPWKFGRQALRAVEFVRGDPRLFAVVVSSFGCGVDGFVLKHLEELLTGRPHLLLEFDEHRGEAGLVTRLEAFADEIGNHLRGGNAPARPSVVPGSSKVPTGKRLFIPHLEQFSRAYSGAFRAAGYETVVLGEPDPETIALGEAHSSGRECHPYTIIAGQFASLWTREDLRPDDVFLSPCCSVPCLLRQYGDAYRIARQRAGYDGPAVLDVVAGEMDRYLGLAGVFHFYQGLVAMELLMVMARRVRPYAARPEEPLALLDEAARGIEEALARMRPIRPVLVEAAAAIWALAVNGRPGDRPVVGVTGDLYTRFAQVGNAGLFDRLEELGTEVWISPFYAPSTQLAEKADQSRWVSRSELGRVVKSALASATAERYYRALARALPAEAVSLVTEPTPETLIAKSRAYSGPSSNWLQRLSVGKLVDFVERGAAGAVSVAGVNCMVGVATAGAIPAIRRDFQGVPMIALSYGGGEGPAQRIRLETFAHQVISRAGR